MNGDDWFFPRGPHLNPTATLHNRSLVNSFLVDMPMTPNPGHASRTTMQRHNVAEQIELRTVFEQLLLDLRMTKMSDSLKYYGLLMQISAWLEINPDAKCTLFHMRPGQQTYRSLNAAGDMRNLHQGPGKQGGEQTYPGDFNIKSATGVTIQIHSVDIRDTAGTVLSTNVPVIAVWIPTELSKPFLIQEQP